MTACTPEGQKEGQRIIHLSLEGEFLTAHNPDVEHERRVAIFDLLEENYFHPLDCPSGPYLVILSFNEKGGCFHIHNEDDVLLQQVVFYLTMMRRLVKDYLLICENYYNAIRSSSPDKIETIDQGRRSLHNEGSQLLQEKLLPQIEIDFNTARRLFTLICVLQIRK